MNKYVILFQDYSECIYWFVSESTSDILVTDAPYEYGIKAFRSRDAEDTIHQAQGAHSTAATLAVSQKLPAPHCPQRDAGQQHGGAGEPGRAVGTELWRYSHRIPNSTSAQKWNCLSIYPTRGTMLKVKICFRVARLVSFSQPRCTSYPRAGSRGTGGTPNSPHSSHVPNCNYLKFFPPLPFSQRDNTLSVQQANGVGRRAADAFKMAITQSWTLLSLPDPLFSLAKNSALSESFGNSMLLQGTARSWRQKPVLSNSRLKAPEVIILNNQNCEQTVRNRKQRHWFKSVYSSPCLDIFPIVLVTLTVLYFDQKQVQV